MSYWHPTITSYEMHNTCRTTITDKGAEATLVVWIPNSDDTDGFCEDVLALRQGFRVGEDLQNAYILRPVRVTRLPNPGRYLADVTGEVINTTQGDYVELGLSSVATTEIQWLDGSGNITLIDVLVTENITYQTEFLTLDYNQFCWDDDGGTGSGSGTGGGCGSYIPLRNSDEAPGLAYHTLKVDTTYEHVNLQAEIAVSGNLVTVEEILFSMDSKTNVTNRKFWTLEKVFGAEQIKAQVNRVERTIERFGNPIGSGSGGTGLESYFWSTVNITYTVRTQGWNKFYRADSSGNNGWDWYRMRIKGNGCPLYYPFPTSPYVDVMLQAG